MPATLAEQQIANSAVLTELYKYNPSALIELYELDLTPLQEYYTSKGQPITTTKYYFHNGYNQRHGTVDADVDWGSPQNTYSAMPIQLEGLEVSSAGQVPRPTLTVSNLNGNFGSLCKAYANLIGARVTRIRTLVKFLNSSNFPTTNLLTNTEAFDTWTQDVDANTTVTANAATAPDGTLTADKLFEANTTPSNHGVTKDFTVAASNVNVCCSVYLKAAGRTNAALRFRNKANSTSGASFNLSAGTISGTTLGSVLRSGIQPMGNDWYRCWIVCSSGTGATVPRIEIYTDTDNNPSTISYAGTLNSGIFVWGAQAEVITNTTLTPSLYQAVGATVGNPTADPFAKFPDDVFFIDRMSEEVPGRITFELAPAWDVEGIQLPRRQVVANICPWTYTEDPCTWIVAGVTGINNFVGTSSSSVEVNKAFFSQRTITNGNGSGALLQVRITAPGSAYSAQTILVRSPGKNYAIGNTLTIKGSNLGGVDGVNDLTVTINQLTSDIYYDSNDLIVTTASQDQCGKRLTSCKIRFGSLSLPFGGFPSAGLYGKPI